jgi:hypothetical protein
VAWWRCLAQPDCHLRLRTGRPVDTRQGVFQSGRVYTRSLVLSPTSECRTGRVFWVLRLVVVPVPVVVIGVLPVAMWSSRGSFS